MEHTGTQEYPKKWKKSIILLEIGWSPPWPKLRKNQFWFCGVDPKPFDVFHFSFNILCFDGHPLTSYLSCTTTYPESFFQLISFILLKPLNVCMCIYVYGTLQYKTDILSEFFLKTAWNMSLQFLNQYTKSSEVWDLCNSYLCMS